MVKHPVDEFLSERQIKKHKIGGCFVTYDLQNSDTYIVDKDGNEKGLRVDSQRGRNILKAYY